MAQHLYLVRGLPGSGKSTFAKNLKAWGVVDSHYETDMMFIDEEGNYKFDPSLLGEYHGKCLSATEISLKDGENVVVSNTFTQLWEMKPYIDLANNLDVGFTVITVEGDYGNIHGVPEEAIERMKQRWENYPA